MRYIKDAWVNKNMMNVINHYDKVQLKEPSTRDFKRRYDRLFKELKVKGVIS